MKSYLDTFFLLLRSGLYGTETAADSIPADTDWNALLSMAQKQTVMGVITDALTRLPAEAQPPRKTMLELSNFSLGNIQTSVQLNSALAKAVKVLERNGIKTILLKGQGIAQCYRAAEMRQCGDIDLYVGKRQYKRAIEVALRELHDNGELHDRTTKHFGVKYNGVEIELHCRAAELYTPWRNRKLQRWCQTQLGDSGKLRRADFFGTTVCLPPVDFDAFYIFLHFWQHFTLEGVGLRQLCDWTMLLHKYHKEIDRRQLQELLQGLGMVRQWQTMGYIAVNRLGLPADEMPLYNPDIAATSKKALRKILQGGNFGQYSPTFNRRKWSYSYLRRKLASLWGHFRNMLQMLSYDPVEISCHFIFTSLHKTWVVGEHYLKRQKNTV